jgi:tetratricopeptide (TPR) repeat protein
MTLADERAKELDVSPAESAEKILRRCRAAAELIQRGQYEEAREALGWLWRGTGLRPVVEGLGAATAAAVLLQVGALSGWLGATRQEGGAQEAAKDLISESAALYEQAGERASAALARSDLALCYWREGAYDEARVLLGRSLEELTEADAERRAVVLLRSVTVECAAGKLRDALEILKASARVLEACENHALRGNFHSLYAVTLRRLGALEGNSEHFDRAIIEHTAAIYHYELARHERYRAYNENNLANLLRQIGLYAQAHEHLDRTAAVFSRLSDTGLLAQSDETRARVFIGEGRFAEAARAVERSVRTLEKGGASAILADALTTQGVAWARLGEMEKSLDVLRRAFRMAEEAGALANAGRAALTLIEEHGGRRVPTGAELYELYGRADELLSGSQDAEEVARLRACALIVMRRMAGPQPGERDFAMHDAVQELEARCIEQALEAAGGSVTRAAKLLGLRHQSFIAMLNTRHRKLLPKRSPAEKRLRSIIKASK